MWQNGSECNNNLKDGKSKVLKKCGGRKWHKRDGKVKNGEWQNSEKIKKSEKNSAGHEIFSEDKGKC